MRCCLNACPGRSHYYLRVYHNCDSSSIRHATRMIRAVISRMSNSTEANQRASRAVGSDYDVIQFTTLARCALHAIIQLQCQSTYVPHLQTTVRPLCRIVLVSCRIVLECISRTVLESISNRTRIELKSQL